MKNNENGQSAAKQYTELKDVPGFEGNYAVTKNGEVYSYKSMDLFSALLMHVFLLFYCYKQGFEDYFYIGILTTELYIGLILSR